jgi:hypothetical protein
VSEAFKMTSETSRSGELATPIIFREPTFKAHLPSNAYELSARQISKISEESNRYKSGIVTNAVWYKQA